MGIPIQWKTLFILKRGRESLLYLWPSRQIVVLKYQKAARTRKCLYQSCFEWKCRKRSRFRLSWIAGMVICFKIFTLNHWGRVIYICVSNLTIIGSDNGLSPSRRQAIIWTSAGIFLIGPLGTKLNEILLRIQPISFKKMHLKMSSGKCRSFCLGLNAMRTFRANKGIKNA